MYEYEPLFTLKITKQIAYTSRSTLFVGHCRPFQMVYYTL